MGFEPKKLALLRILEIYQKYSNSEHVLTYDDIARRLLQEYGIEIERKAIGRNVSMLREAGYDIVLSRYGSYLAERAFDDAELRLLIDGILSSKHISETHSRQLIEKLSALSNVYFRSHIKNIYSVGDWSKTENNTLFYNISIVYEAIENLKQIRFDYNKYWTDKKLHRSAIHTVSPYQLLLHNQRYYLMAYNEKWKHIAFYRMDRITKIGIIDEPITPLRTIPGCENGIDYRKISGGLPYMFSDNAEIITFYAKPEIVDQIIDWFGYDVEFKEEDEWILVTVYASPNAMEYWALQYLNYIEIITPAHLRKRIQNDLKIALDKYGEQKGE